MKILKPIMIAALTMSLSTAAFAQTANSADLPQDQDQLEQATQQLAELDTTNTTHEIMGGRILNKEDGSEIHVECVRTGETGACEAVHYVLQSGFATTTLTSDIEMKDVMALMNTMKHEFTDTAAKEAGAHRSTFAHPTLFPVTKAIYGPSFDKHSELVTIGGGATMTLGMVVLGGLAMGGPVVAIVAGGAIAGIWGFPVIADTAILPFQLLWIPLKDLQVGIHNLIADGKFSRQAKRLAKAFALTAKEGNRETKLKDEDFQLLVSIISGKASN